MTHTLATIQVPPQFYNLVRKVMKDAGYEHAILDDEGMLDMTGIALTTKRGNIKEK